MSKTITPINGYVVLKPVEETEQMFGAIVVPDLGKERGEMAKVVAASPTYNFHKGEFVEPTVATNDVVLIPKMGSQRIVIDGEDYYICKETEIIGILN